MLARAAKAGSPSRSSFGYKAQIVDITVGVIRGYGESSVECELHELGLRSVAIDRTASRPSVPNH